MAQSNAFFESGETYITLQFFLFFFVAIMVDIFGNILPLVENDCHIGNMDIAIEYLNQKEKVPSSYKVSQWKKVIRTNPELKIEQNPGTTGWEAAYHVSKVKGEKGD